MATLIASYNIDTEDKHVFLLLDSTIWRRLVELSGTATESGLWYLDTNLSPEKVCETLINVFDNKKGELAKTIDKNLIDKSIISLNVHEFNRNNGVTYNDNRAQEWFAKKGQMNVK